MMWFLLALVVFAILGVLIDSSRSRGIRQQWVQGRSPMPDSDFAAAISLSGEDARIACALRRALAQTVDIPSEMIHPSDTWETFNRLMCDGMDRLEPLFRLERALGIKLSLRTVWDDPFKGMARESVPKQMGEIITLMARSVAAHLQTVQK